MHMVTDTMEANIKNPILGAIVGDIIGSRFEFEKPFAKKGFELFTKDCHFTDDTVMTLAVAAGLKDSYLTKSSKDIAAAVRDSMYEIGDKYPDCGYGPMFITWLIKPDKKPYGSLGNGCIMRCSSAGYYGRTNTEAKNLGYLSALPTHDHTVSLLISALMSEGIWMGLNGYSKEKICDLANKELLDDLREYYKDKEIETDTMLVHETYMQVMDIFEEADSFEECIRKAVMMGGDTDTRAAVIGSLAGAYYGVPLEMAKKVEGYLDDLLYMLLTYTSSKDEEGA